MSQKQLLLIVELSSCTDVSDRVDHFEVQVQGLHDSVVNLDELVEVRLVPVLISRKSHVVFRFFVKAINLCYVLANKEGLAQILHKKRPTIYVFLALIGSCDTCNS